MVRQIIKMLVPKPVRAFLQRSYREFIFHNAMKKFQQDPENAITNEELIADLIYGWGNEGWSALEEFLTGSLKHVRECSGPILECGSGLSTILVGLIAQRAGTTVWSLEHSTEWGGRVDKYLKKYRIHSVRLSIAPLKGFELFEWYAPPLESMPADFRLVLCDGPPGIVRGGRYGLLPIMRERLQPGCIILLDDAGRVEEQAIAARWANELHTEVERCGSAKPYFRIIVPKN